MDLNSNLLFILLQVSEFLRDEDMLSEAVATFAALVQGALRRQVYPFASDLSPFVRDAPRDHSMAEELQEPDSSPTAIFQASHCQSSCLQRDA